jgi:hypothetical protein
MLQSALKKPDGAERKNPILLGAAFLSEKKVSRQGKFVVKKDLHNIKIPGFIKKHVLDAK